MDRALTSAALGEAVLQAALSRSEPRAVRQTALLPLAGISGMAAVETPAKANCCELVTEPPPSARPPQENRRT